MAMMMMIVGILKSRGEFLMIGYLYKVYRNIIKVQICVPNWLTLILTQCVCRVYLSISILNTTRYYYRSNTIIYYYCIKYIYVPDVHINIYMYVVTYS